MHRHSIRILGGLAFLLAATLASADGPLEQESPAQEALDEAKRQEAEALRHLYDAHDRVKAIADPARPEKAKATANFKIVNGLLTSRFPTAGAFLKVDASGTPGSWCTGTLIGCRTFLTARHCVASDLDANAPARPEEFANYRVFLQHGGVFDVTNIATHPDYDFPLADLAVVTLATSVNGITPTPLNDRAAIAPGNSGTIVGFGRSGGARTDYGLKRAGSVITATCRDQNLKLLCWNFDPGTARPGEVSNTCNADSGGPLFVDDMAANPVRSVLAGVTSGGTRGDCLRLDHSYDVDVHAFATWIDEQTTDPLGPASCGALPAWGTDPVVMRRASGTLSDVRTEARYTLEVPADVAMLRVALNAEDSNSTIDFDLYARTGAAPTAAQADCKRDDASQYAFCEFSNPQAGPWHFWVNRKKGTGLFQLTATWFEE